MALYKYRAKDKGGSNVEGTLEVGTEKELIDILRNKGLMVISISEEKKKQIFSKKKKGKKVKSEELVIFSRQLATMIDAGLPLVQSLNILHEQAENQTFKDILKDIEQSIEGGSTLSESLGKYPKVFSGLFVNMVRAGEASGTLDEIMERLAAYMESSENLKRKVKSALIYPIAVMSVAFLIVVFMMIFVVPKFGEIFEGFGGAKLPGPTQFLIDVSRVMTSIYALIVVGVGVVVIFMSLKYIKTEQGRYKWDSILLKLPVFGILLRKVAISKFSRTLSTLLKSGVPILTALDIVAKTAGNKVIESVVNDTRNNIREGESIAEPLSKSDVFPPMVVRMISVGEQTGALEDMLSRIADFYDEQVNAAVEGLTSLIEPLLISFLGVVVGGIVICMFLPIFKMTEVINK
jgi:type IV pilus assembly protein PilC